MGFLSVGTSATVGLTDGTSPGLSSLAAIDWMRRSALRWLAFGFSIVTTFGVATGCGCFSNWVIRRFKLAFSVFRVSMSCASWWAACGKSASCALICLILAVGGVTCVIMRAPALGWLVVTGPTITLVTDSEIAGPKA